MGYHRSGWAGLVVIAFSAVHAGCSSSEPYPGDRAPAGGGIGGTMATGGTSGIGGTGGTAGSTGSAGGTTTTTGTPLLMCDPSVDSVVDEGCGVFVSSSKGDDMAGDGTKANPFATIAKAVSAVGDMGRLYLCAEDFVEAVSVSNGVVIHGGLDCSDMKWPWVGNMTKTKIAPNQGEIPLTVDSQVALTVEDVAFEATAKDMQSGSSSIAIIAGSAAALALTRCDVKAGDAKDGANAKDLPPGPAAPGIDGKPGGTACSNPMVAGGAAVENLCDPGDVDDGSVGGSGGAGSKSQGSNGDPGLPLEGNAMPNGGMGQLYDMGMCSDGGGGANGAAGASGAGGTGLGTVPKSGYQGAAGVAGEKGRPGQGGGGGGGAKGGSGSGMCPDAIIAGGASGGSGGAGGCGGLGGNGGQAGGSSIGILSLGATLKLTEVTITTGQGGKGGSGKAGQTGGIGGAGGKGGVVPGATFGLMPGCAGGQGGKGGNGGAGGGGRGGHSIGIAYTGALPPSAGVMITKGMSGPGGYGGTGGANEGDYGVSAEMQKFD